MTFNLSDRITIAVWSWALNYICIIMCIGIWKLALITLLLRYHVHHKLMLITVSVSTFYICPHVDIPVKRKIEKREKVLYHKSVLKRNPFVQRVPSSVVRKKDKKKTNKKKSQETHEEKSVPMVLTLRNECKSVYA
jgi:hypothetical protein